MAEALTYEKVLELFRETDRKFQERDKKFNEELEKAGIGTIIDEKQRQLDEWSSSQQK